MWRLTWSNNYYRNILNFQTKLWVFPEGARFNKGSIQPFKKGAFYLAIDAQIPIMPVVFSQYYFLDNETKTFEPGNEKKYILLLNN